MAHVVAGAELRLARCDLPPRRFAPTGPRTGEPGHRLIAARGLALFVARAALTPVEVGPLIALLGLDGVALLDAVGRELAEESRGRVFVGPAEQHPVARVREIRPVL